MTDDVARIAPIDPADAPEDLAPFLQGGVDGTGALNIFTTLANHPGLLRRYLPFGGKLLQGGVLEARTREIFILRTAWNTGSEYEWGQHVRIGRDVGLSDEEILRIARGPEAGWSPDDVVVLVACDELCTDRDLSDATWDALTARFDTRELVELTMLVGHYVMIAGMLKSLRVRREPGVAGFPDLG